MSHRKYHAPRHGHTGFLPRKRCTTHRGRIHAFPRDDTEQKPHFTAFIGYKAGMTHVIRDLDRRGSNSHGKEVCEPVTIIDCPPMVVIGMVGYVETPQGLRALTTVWSEHISDEARRRFYKNWYRAKHRAFSSYAAKYADQQKEIKTELARMKEYCSVIRVIAHTQPSKVPIAQRCAHILEIQINGGSVADKVDFGYQHFEKPIAVGDVFSKDELVDHAGITKGKGFQGTVRRFGVGILTRKTRRGSRRVACIGPWHPSNVMTTIARAGQMGYHHRTDLNKKVMLIGNGSDPRSGSTSHDITDKQITPMGGFPHYGQVLNDFLMIRGGITGSTKRAVTLRKAIRPSSVYAASEVIDLKYIDTTSKIGRGRFTTSAAKAAAMGRA